METTIVLTIHTAQRLNWKSFSNVVLSSRMFSVIIYIAGALAEWLRGGLQNLLHRFNSGRRLQLL